MQLEHPVMGKRKDQEPQEQHQIVEYGAPQEEITDCKVMHGVSRHDS
jgi:hypothetical protein